MKALVVYDSIYGNTQQIAEAIAKALGADTEAVKVGRYSGTNLETVDLLIIGSPTLGGRPSEPMQAFLEGLGDAEIKGKRFAAFDTRYSGKFVKLFGFAADRISEKLTAKGGTAVAPPEAFYVTGKRGPLKEGELGRASDWAKKFANG